MWNLKQLLPLNIFLHSRFSCIFSLHIMHDLVPGIECQWNKGSDKSPQPLTSLFHWFNIKYVIEWISMSELTIFFLQKHILVVDLMDHAWPTSWFNMQKVLDEALSLKEHACVVLEPTISLFLCEHERIIYPRTT